jgi:hypothetical protein
MAESSLSIARALADASGLVESDARLWRSAVETVQSAHAQLRQLVSDNQ